MSSVIPESSALRPSRPARLLASTKERAQGCRTALAVFSLLILAACSSEALPPPLNSDQLQAIAAAHFKATVGVRKYTAPVYSDYLLEFLRKTKLFDEVAPLEEFKTPPTFAARVDRGIYGTATIPILTIISLGIIPTTIEEEHGLEFSLIPTSSPKTAIAVRYSYKGPSTLGWWAFYRGFLPDETWFAADRNVRFVQSLAWHIVEHKDEISAYIK